MIIKTAKFVTSSQRSGQCPPSRLPEYAFIGRSNVGKSSLINMLVQQKGLAKTSATPGKTLLINHFLINDSWYLVDLPGYGYARASKTAKERLSSVINDYITKREQLTMLFVLVDIRHEAQAADLEFIARLGTAGVPFAIVFTKADKLSSAARKKQLENYQQTLLQDWEELPPMFVTSSETQQGREMLLDYIDEVNRNLRANKK